MKLHILTVMLILNTSLVPGSALDCYACRHGASLTEENGPDNPSCKDDYVPKDNDLITCNSTNSMSLMRNILGGIDSNFTSYSRNDLDLEGANTLKGAPTYLCGKQTVEGSKSGVWRGCINNTSLYEGNKCKNGEMGDMKWYQCICDGNRCNSATFLTTGVNIFLALLLTVFKL